MFLCLVTKLIEVDICIYNVLNYVNFNLHLTNVRIVVILLVISENMTSWVSFYFRTSTFENVLYLFISFLMYKAIQWELKTYVIVRMSN